MSAGSTMELNAKSPFFWDWENLVMFNAKTEVPKKHQLVDSEIEAVGGFEAGSLHSSGGRSDGASASGGAASDFGWSSTKSSKSASTDSSMNKEIKESKFTLETIERLQQDLSSNKELLGSVPARTSSAIEGSVGSGESLIGLKLGKRTYFEAVSAGGNAKHSGMVTIVPDSTGKRCKTSSLSTEVPRCQVEGCNLDLSSAKDYHRKHRVCENHSKSPKVIINGVERRFCQQCSRFHGLSEFDQRKRSCRRRLTDHNARRRKPKPEVIQFNSMRLSSSLFEDRNHMSLAFNQEPLVQTRPDINSTWDSTSNSKCTQGKLSLFNSTKSGNVGVLHVPDSGLEYLSTKPCSESANFLPSKGASSEVFSRGIPVAMTSGNLHGGQDHLRALSLLSTNTWGSCDPDNSPLDHPMHGATHQPFPTMQAAPLDPLCEYWQDEQPVTSGSSFQRNDDDNSSQFQEFQLFKAPNEPGFYLY